MRTSLPPGHRPARRVTPLAALLAAVAATAMVAAGCTTGGAVTPVATGPAVTLRIAVYGTPGYQQSGLLSSYEQLHPGTRIVVDSAAAETGYWQGLQHQLADKAPLDDLVAIPFGDMSGVLARYAGRFVPLSTLGGVAGGVNTIADTELPWIQRPASKSGQDYAIGAESGPLALCYRPGLLREAGLPSSPAQLARDWSTWRGYLASGRLFRQRIPHGPAFMDSVTSMYNAMVSQAGEQYYSAAARLALAHNPAVKRAWRAATGAAAAGLSAGLSPLTSGWSTGVARISFATAVCPSWLLGSIEHLSGPRGQGSWAVTTVPGGTGDWGGFYLAVPRSSAHQEDAYQLATYLTSEQAGTALAHAGAFPASSPAINATSGVVSPYFGDAPVGRIFGLAADRVPAAPPGPAASAIGADLDSALTSVEAGTAPSRGWARAVRQATAAFHSARSSR
jgi:cellobiose transport system substrate-binding protein